MVILIWGVGKKNHFYISQNEIKQFFLSIFHSFLSKVRQIIGNILLNRQKLIMLSLLFNQKEKAACTIQPAYIYMTSDNKIFTSFTLCRGEIGSISYATPQ